MKLTKAQRDHLMRLCERPTDVRQSKDWNPNVIKRLVWMDLVCYVEGGLASLTPSGIAAKAAMEVTK